MAQLTLRVTAEDRVTFNNYTLQVTCAHCVGAEEGEQREEEEQRSESGGSQSGMVRARLPGPRGFVAPLSHASHSHASSQPYATARQATLPLGLVAPRHCVLLVEGKRVGVFATQHLPPFDVGRDVGLQVDARGRGSAGLDGAEPSSPPRILAEPLSPPCAAGLGL